MSITLIAYPTAFLINPEAAKKEKIKKSCPKTGLNQKTADQNLKFIRVLTNIEQIELLPLMSYFKCQENSKTNFTLSNGINVNWTNYGKYLSATVQADMISKKLQEEGEKFFKDLDNIAKRNVRLINSGEYFYFNYETSYTTIPEIYEALKQQKATGIFPTSEGEIVAEINGQSIKYYLPKNSKKYYLEVEQKVQIMNIGLNGGFDGRNVTFGLTNLSIQTNIKSDELKQLLKKSNYLLYKENMQTPLKSTNATLNWVLKDGYYRAEFSGSNNSAITKEAEIIFRKMNISAGRDLRLINDVSTAIYTYTTNYTDKGVLLNTLYEHGAQEIKEKGYEVSCKLFGMEMVYYKNNNDEAYTLDITQITSEQDCQNVIDELNEEYGLNIQEMTYNKIKERLDKSGMRIESETVEEDNSIVLTIEI